MPTYLVHVDGQEHTVTVKDGAAVAFDGIDCHAELLSSADKRRVIVASPNSSTPMVVIKDGTTYDVCSRGVRWKIAVRSERERLRRQFARTTEGPTLLDIRAPMPALVVRTEVSEGQEVEAGALLLVLEAMKMENDLCAPAAGMVKTLHVARGTTVEKDQLILTILRS